MLLNSADSGFVKAAIEGIVFIPLEQKATVFIGEMIEFQAQKTLSIYQGMVIGLSTQLAEIVLFGTSSDLAPGDN
jgi:hypothetical protein